MLVAQTTLNTPSSFQADVSQLHLIDKTPPVYPALARAAHIDGVVTAQIEIGPDGRVASAKILSGPGTLRFAAKDALRQWLYTPIVVNGKAIAVTTTVTLPFDLKVPASQYAQSLPNDAQDRKLDARLNWLEADCTRSLESNKGVPAKQVELCRKAAEFSEHYSVDGYAERCRTFTYLSKALLQDRQLTDALSAADRAIAAAREGFEEGPRVSAAYSVRAEIEAHSGKLAQALDDLTIAEDNERDAIAEMSVAGSNKDYNRTMQSYTKTNYVPVLKSLLIYHAQILTTLGKPNEAQIKRLEAEKL